MYIHIYMYMYISLHIHMYIYIYDFVPLKGGQGVQRVLHRTSPLIDKDASQGTAHKGPEGPYGPDP